MTDADDAVVLDVIREVFDAINDEDPHAGYFLDADTVRLLDAMKNMPDKGPLIKSLGFSQLGARFCNRHGGIATDSDVDRCRLYEDDPEPCDWHRRLWVEP